MTAAEEPGRPRFAMGGGAVTGGGHRPVTAGGRRLLGAFEALERFPALSHSRRRLLELAQQPQPSRAQLVAVVESDPALAIGVLRAANGGAARGRGPADVPGAIRSLSAPELEAVAARVVTFEFFDRSARWNAEAERFRLHALATRQVAERLGRASLIGVDDELLAAALLHDIGKLVMLHAYKEYPAIAAERGTPEQRLRLERRELGVDHALVGGVLARRLGLPARLGELIERHHSPDARGPAAMLRLADMVTHYVGLHPVDQTEMFAAGAACGLDDEAVRSALYALALPGESREVEGDPCPLTTRELEILRQLGEGKRYKEIALLLGLTPSTVRSHLHKSYRKLGVEDRAQAVLMATSRGWI